MLSSEFEQQRNVRLGKMRAINCDPYGKTHETQEVASTIICANALRKAIKETTGNDTVNTDIGISTKIQGRIVLLRDNGGLIWLQIKDDTGIIQAAISKKDVASEVDFQKAKLLDLGDIVYVEGNLRYTKSGELTVWVKNLEVQCKSLCHPPEKHAGLQNVETRYRKRYLDMAFNNDFANTLKIRSFVVSRIRNFFEKNNYIEVETPMLHPLAGGAAAKPFKTHLNALDIDLFLRVAPELYLKKLVVGGLKKIFEINRNFRNEGIDATHNPEFTALEAYSINESCYSLSLMTLDLLREIVQEVKKEMKVSEDLPGSKVHYNNQVINLDTPHFTTYEELYKRGTGRDLFSELDFFEANKRFEQECEPLIDPCIPTFVSGYPSAISPLTKQTKENALISQRIDLFIGGMEIGTMYTEQNDPQIQFDIFLRQVSDAEESTHRTMDESFIDALKVGMPPTGGLGIGIDRLVMLICNKTSIRDVIAFPFMRPINSEVKNDESCA